ncbi:hypothetical protein [Cohnella sp.]|uniref:hypothetical protein n=1 Tax=Cohnella sp. TaxID=1883426 RepID=UPI0035662C23
MNKQLMDIQQDGDSLFNEFFEWLEGQYDTASGGFYYAQSSKRSGQFTPDIESTGQALNILERCRLLDRLNASVREKTIRYFQSKQDPMTGLFYDTDPNMRLDDVMVGRATGYSIGALGKFGASPLYPFPKQSAATPAYMESPQTLEAWLRSISLTNSWRGCDKLSHCATYVLALSMGERAPYLAELFAYLADLQHPSTGLWGNGSRYVQISGTFKLHLLYNRFGIPMQRVDHIYDSILDVLRKEHATDMCYIRNPISLLSSMKISIPLDEMTEIAEITIANMAKLKREDGAFSREIDRSPPAPNIAQVKKGETYPDMPIPVPLGLGLVESDMNASTQAVLIRYTLRELSGLPVQHLPVPQSLLSFSQI